MKKILDCLMMTERAKAHEYIASVLKFPDYYGRNLDALFDCLCEYSGMIILKNAQIFKENPGYGLKILHTFCSGDAVNPNLSAVIFDGEIPQRNSFHERLERLEFVMTYACTGNCIHCSEAEKDLGFKLSGEAASRALLRAAAVYDIKSVMVFGGEPMICAGELSLIMRAAKNAGIECRQIITNGYFSRDAEKIVGTAKLVAGCGANDVLISADAFHQQTVPLEPVQLFAEELIGLGVKVRINPAWLVSKEDSNPYNLKTREIVSKFEEKGISQSKGNTVFPEGNAVKYLSEYFDGDNTPENPYKQNPEDVRAVCIEPDGKLYGNSIYKEDILDILREYDPLKQ